MWWAAAVLSSAAGLALSLQPRELFMFTYGFCWGHEASYALGDVAWLLRRVFWYGGAPAVLLGLLTQWWPPRPGRIATRVLAACLLLAYGLVPFGILLDVGMDRSCFDTWGRWVGVRFYLEVYLAPTLAALCMLAAVRVPKRRARVRRAAPAVAALSVLAWLPVADMSIGPITDGPCSDTTGERAYLCQARAEGRFTEVADTSPWRTAGRGAPPTRRPATRRS